MIVASDHVPINNGRKMIAFDSSSKLIFYTNTGLQKSFFIGFFDANQIFHLYNITDFSKLGNENGEKTMRRVAKADLKTGTQSRYNEGYLS
jgi:hypothetical protein